jgi:hypothetical protein
VPLDVYVHLLLSQRQLAAGFEELAERLAL